MKTKLANDPEVRKMAIRGAQEMLRIVGVNQLRLLAQSVAPTGRKRNLSPEARKRISAAQKRRWAAYHKKSARRTKG